MSIGTEGIIKRDGGGFVVKVPGLAHLAELPGVTCENPDAQPDKRIYCKRFARKRIFLPRQYADAVDTVLAGTDVIVLGMNGYTSITPEQCRAWGVRPGAYEAACAGILKSVYQTLVSAFPGIDVRFSDGAATLGVDLAIIKTARELNRPHLGHSCPKFMFYVEDDDDPVYVAATQAAYANAFIDSMQILIAANGRVQAFEQDIDAVFKKLKHLIPVNILRVISTTGGPPAIGATGKIEDAVAAFEQRVHMASQMIYGSCDPFRSMVEHICDSTRAIVRPLISPERAFGDLTATGSLP